MDRLQGVISRELDALAPYEGHESADWDDVLNRAGVALVLRKMPSRGARIRVRRRQIAIVIASLLVLATIPSLAFSSQIRDVLGLDEPARPVLAEATLLVEEPVGDGRIARVYSAPSEAGGECWFVAYVPEGSAVRPRRQNGAASCTVGSASRDVPPPDVPILWSASIQPRPSGDRKWIPPTIDGWINPNLEANEVYLEWSGASLPFAFSNHHFLLVDERLYNLPIERAPYSIVAYDANDREVARVTLPTEALRPG
jgi:hypothetical protein